MSLYYAVACSAFYAVPLILPARDLILKPLPPETNALSLHQLADFKKYSKIKILWNFYVKYFNQKFQIK